MNRYDFLFKSPDISKEFFRASWNHRPEMGS